MGEGQVSSDGTVTRLERYCQCRIGRLAINRRWLEGWDARRLDRREEALLGRLPGDTKAAKVLGIESVDCHVSLGCLRCE